MCWYHTYPLAYMPAVLFLLLAAILATAINISLYLENIGTIAMMKVFTIGLQFYIEQTTKFFTFFSLKLVHYIQVPLYAHMHYISQQFSLLWKLFLRRLFWLLMPKVVKSILSTAMDPSHPDLLRKSVCHFLYSHMNGVSSKILDSIQSASTGKLCLCSNP